MDNSKLLQRLGIILAYPLAYAYIRLVFLSFDLSYTYEVGSLEFSVAYPIFALLFIIVNEIVRRGRRGAGSNPPRETVFWYAMTFLSGLTATIGPSEELSVFALHLSAVYSVLISNDILFGGKTSGFIIADLIHGFYVKSFAGFPNFVTDWGCFKREKKESGAEKTKKNVFGVVVFIVIMVILFTISIAFMGSIDPDIELVLNNVFNGIFDYLDELQIEEVILRMFLAIPVCFYLYGLMSRSAKSDGRTEKKVASWLTRISNKGKTVSERIVYVAAGVFVLSYILFMIKRLAYMFGGFSHTVPDGYLVSQYAREGFFELVGIMAVNMCAYVAIILLGKRNPEGKFALPAKILVTLLMVESLIFAIVAMSKLGLYYGTYGYTPKRVLAMWATIALGFSACMSITTVLRSKSHSGQIMV